MFILIHLVLFLSTLHLKIFKAEEQFVNNQENDQTTNTGIEELFLKKKENENSLYKILNDLKNILNVNKTLYNKGNGKNNEYEKTQNNLFFEEMQKSNENREPSWYSSHALPWRKDERSISSILKRMELLGLLKQNAKDEQKSPPLPWRKDELSIESLLRRMESLGLLQNNIKNELKDPNGLPWRREELSTNLFLNLMESLGLNANDINDDLKYPNSALPWRKDELSIESLLRRMESLGLLQSTVNDKLKNPVVFPWRRDELSTNRFLNLMKSLGLNANNINDDLKYPNSALPWRKDELSVESLLKRIELLESFKDDKRNELINPNLPWRREKLSVDSLLKRIELGLNKENTKTLKKGENNFANFQRKDYNTVTVDNTINNVKDDVMLDDLIEKKIK